MSEQWEYLVETWRQSTTTTPLFGSPRPLDLDAALGKSLTAKGRERWEPVSLGRYDRERADEVIREVIFRRSTTRRT